MVTTTKRYRMAAEQRNADAQYQLDDAYILGEGVAEDPINAYAWYSVAKRFGNEDAVKHVLKLKDELSLKEIKQGDSQAAVYSKPVNAGAGWQHRCAVFFCTSALGRYRRANAD